MWVLVFLGVTGTLVVTGFAAVQIGEALIQILIALER